MKFHCPDCHAKYRISEDKLESRPNAKLRCKQCSTVFSVRAAVAAEKEAGGSSTDALSIPPSEVPAPPVRPKAGDPKRTRTVGSSALLSGAASSRASVASRGPGALSSTGASRATTRAPLPAPRSPGLGSAAAARPTATRSTTSAATASTAARKTSSVAKVAPGTSAPARSTSATASRLSPASRGLGSRSGSRQPIGLGSSRVSQTDATVSSLPDRSKREEQGSRGPLPKLPPSIAARSAKAKAPAASSSSRSLATPLPHAPSEALGRSRGVAGAAAARSVSPVALSDAESEPEVTSEPAPALVSSLPAPDEEPAPTSGVSRSELPLASADSEPPNSDETLVMSHSAFDGWFVRLDNASQGPLEEALLRAHVAAGRIDESTPVWREGAAEWQPAGSYPALFALIVAQKNSPAAGAAASSALPPADGRSSALPAPSVQSSQGALPQQRSDELSDAAVSRSVPAPAVAERAKPTRSSLLPEAFSHLPGLPRRRMVPARHAWASTVAALGFGVAVGYLIWGADPAAVPTEATAAAAAAVEPSPNEAARDEAPPKVEDVPAAAAEAEPEQPEEPQANKQRAQSSSASGAKAPASSNDKAQESSSSGGLLAGLSGVAAGGPRAPGSSGQSGRGGEGLDGAAIQRTVQRYQPSVRRSCWQRALSSRSALAPSSARVTVTIRIAPSGKVTGVSHSGEPAGYPGLANCITSKVRGWTFPAAAGPTTANVPFVFAAQ